MKALFEVIWRPWILMETRIVDVNRAVKSNKLILVKKSFGVGIEVINSDLHWSWHAFNLNFEVELASQMAIYFVNIFFIICSREKLHMKIILLTNNFLAIVKRSFYLFVRLFEHSKVNLTHSVAIVKKLFGLTVHFRNMFL